MSLILHTLLFVRSKLYAILELVRQLILMQIGMINMLVCYQ
jgi:hypothetical protein